MKRVFNHSVARLAAIALLAVAVLSGCGGGASTEENPDLTPPTQGSNYNGPVPATADIQAFRVNFWEKVLTTATCANCHNAAGQTPQFARTDDVNAAYQQASGVVDRNSPSQSIIVAKVGGGHNCWLPDAGSCASIMTRWIQDWVGGSGTGGRAIELIEPVSKDPGSSRRLPATAPESYSTDEQIPQRSEHALLTTYCADCHRSTATTKQSPFFAASDVQESYQAAIPKINLDDPENSRFVIRLGLESHNCWSDCATNAAEMQAAIQMMTDSITPSQVDPNLMTSKALTLFDGTVAAGGNRYENNLIALYEFKTGNGKFAFDTSGVAPAADLEFTGDVTWVGGWGINVRTGMAKAQTTASRKFHQLITATGEYSVEAWVVPGNVTQEDARIVSYSGSTTARNFTMGQTMYNYDFFARSSKTGANGTPQLSTADADERLQASLQHVVMTFDPVNGRRIYVNGEFTGDLDSAGGGTLGDWDNSFAFVLGNEVSNNRQWTGRDPPGGDPQPRADAATDPAELRGRRRREVLHAVRHLAPGECAEGIHPVRGPAVRQRGLPVHQPEVRQPRHHRDAGQHSDQGHAYRRERRRADGRPGVSPARHRDHGRELLSRDRPDAVVSGHDHRAGAGSDLGRVLPLLRHARRAQRRLLHVRLGLRSRRSSTWPSRRTSASARSTRSMRRWPP